jgi:hypothetical protein
MKKLIFSSYFIFLLALGILSYLFVDPNFIYLSKLYTGFAFVNRTVTTLIYSLFVVSFFVFYLIFVKLSRDNKLSGRECIALIILTAGVLLFSYPAMLSYDIFNYIATAKVAFFYHENPYLIMPIQFANDPVLLFTHAANKTALYGPLWISITGIPYLLGIGNFLLTLLNFKLFISIFYLASSFLVYRLSKNIQSVVLFSLNPLIIVESLISGHNDIAMMFLVLISLYFMKRRIIGISFYIFSILIKYSTIFLLPIYVVLFVRRKVNRYSFLYSAISMFVIFLLSPLRGEFYPWYAIWFLPLLFIFTNEGALLLLIESLCFGLLLSYLPFMYSGTYSGLTPMLKLAFTFLPVAAVIIYVGVKYLWPKFQYR